MIEIIWGNIWMSVNASRSELRDEEGISDQLFAQMMGWAQMIIIDGLYMLLAIEDVIGLNEGYVPEMTEQLLAQMLGWG